MPLLEEALKAMNIRTVSKEDFEADDILATLAAQGAEDGYRVLVVSGDRDTIQLVTPNVTLLYPNARGVTELKLYDRDAVVERYGIEPEQYRRSRRSWGRRATTCRVSTRSARRPAVKWIQQYGTVDELLKHVDDIPGVVGNNLRAQTDRVIRNRKLNRLLTDVDLPVKPADLARQPIDPTAVREIFGRLQFRTLLDRVFKVEGQAEDAGIVPDAREAGDRGPAVRTMVDEELARSGSAPSRSRARATRAAHRHAQRPGRRLRHLQRDRERFRAVGSGASRLHGARGLARERRPTAARVEASTQSLAGTGLELNGIVGDTSMSAWLLRPAIKPDTLGSLVYYYLGEALPEPDPSQLVPETEAVSPATEAWYIASARRRARCAPR